MIRTVLIDDEPNNINILQQLLLRYCPVVEIVGTADSAKTGGINYRNAARPGIAGY